MKNLSLFVFLILCLTACKDDDMLIPTPTENEPEPVCAWCPDSTIIIDIGDFFAHPWGDTLV